MKNKNLILAIFLVLIVFLGSSVVFAEDASDVQTANVDEIEVQENADIAEISASQEYTVEAGSTSDQIQEKINSMSDGDTLNFENSTYDDVCIYVANKSITINGNGAVLKGYDNPSLSNVADIIKNPTNQSGYGITNVATLYVVQAPNVTINGLTIIGGENSGSSTAGPAYSNALVYIEYSNNLTFSKNVIDGSSWGVYLRFSNDCIIADNTIRNQEVTGILNFGSARTIIKNNKVINAKNHGIDVRHGTGPNVQVIKNTVIGSKEGIYLMHSQGHTASENTIVNCTISAISCYGSSNIELNDNVMKKSRIGVLLGGGYSNINIGNNTYALDNLPYPPTFVYYIAEAKSDYQSAANIMGTFSDSTTNYPNYVEYTDIPTPADININYSELTKETGTKYIVPEGATSAQIQNQINSMNNGDTLEFTKNAVYNDICIYTDKNIKIIGNNATLIGYDSYNLATVPTKVKAASNESGYAISEHAVLYILNNTNVVVSGLNIVAKYPGYDTTNVTPKTVNYKTAGIRAQYSPNLTILHCTIDGASWGIYMEYSSGAIVANNLIKNQYTTGILNFGTGQSIIANNVITDAVNHGIDVRHGTGPRVTVYNNTISGAKEGIYLMHSQGHKVYKNTVINSKISSITCYGSGNEAIFDNDLKGSRIAFLLGGGYYNVTIGNNSYSLDTLPFPPTFATYLARADSKYQSADGAIGIFSDKIAANLTLSGKTSEYLLAAEKGISYEITLTDSQGNALKNRDILVSFNNVNQTVTTDENGTASVLLTATATGSQILTVTFAGDDSYSPVANNETAITISQEKSKITAKKATFKAKKKTKKYTIKLKSASGKAIAKVKVYIKVKGKTYKAKTNAKGKATFKITKLTKKGKHNAKITFKGNKYYKGKTAKVKITVKK
ncbi:right-handed parallel beta-helix repeat-containing protein [Methanobrevibacter sp.]|uniref:right-handed parallel beta-helix repeat-containing protein n=1 Tax=Methanobrevibacter sp. TaxID=66852 RepID=UPI003890EBEE